MKLRLCIEEFNEKIRGYCKQQDIKYISRVSKEIHYQDVEGNDLALEEEQETKYKYKLRVEDKKELQIDYVEEVGLVELRGIGIKLTDIKGWITDILEMMGVEKGYRNKLLTINNTENNNFDIQVVSENLQSKIRVKRELTLCCGDTYAMEIMLQIDEIEKVHKYHLKGVVEYDTLTIDPTTILSNENASEYKIGNDFGKGIIEGIKKVDEGLKEIECHIDKVKYQEYFNGDGEREGYSQEYSAIFYVIVSGTKLLLGEFTFSYEEWESDINPRKFYIALRFASRARAEDGWLKVLQQESAKLFTELNRIEKDQDIDALLIIKGELLNCRVKLNDFGFVIQSNNDEIESQMKDKFIEYEGSKTNE